MRKNVFAAGILMAAAIAVAGFGGTTRGMVQASAASVSTNAVMNLINEQNTAAQKALEYVGTGYEVVSVEQMPGTAHVYKVGVAPEFVPRFCICVQRIITA